MYNKDHLNRFFYITESRKKGSKTEKNISQMAVFSPSNEESIRQTADVLKTFSILSWKLVVIKGVVFTKLIFMGS